MKPLLDGKIRWTNVHVGNLSNTTTSLCNAINELQGRCASRVQLPKMFSNIELAGLFSKVMPTSREIGMFAVS